MWTQNTWMSSYNISEQTSPNANRQNPTTRIRPSVQVRTFNQRVTTQHAIKFSNDAKRWPTFWPSIQPKPNKSKIIPNHRWNVIQTVSEQNKNSFTHSSYPTTNLFQTLHHYGSSLITNSNTTRYRCKTFTHEQTLKDMLKELCQSCVQCQFNKNQRRPS